MADIFFTKNGSTYEATFEASSDFNVHLEREEAGQLIIQQRTAGTKFAPTITFSPEHIDCDYDFVGYVYPKTIKILSDSKVNLGIVTER